MPKKSKSFVVVGAIDDEVADTDELTLVENT